MKEISRGNELSTNEVRELVYMLVTGQIKPCKCEVGSAWLWRDENDELLYGPEGDQIQIEPYSGGANDS